MGTFSRRKLPCREFCERYKGYSVSWRWHTLFWIGFPASCDQRHSSRTRVNSVPVFTCKTEFSHCVCTLASCLQWKVQSWLQLVTLYDFVSLIKRREKRGENPRGDWVHLHRVPVGSCWLPVVTWFCGESWSSTYWNWEWGERTLPFRTCSLPSPAELLLTSTLLISTDEHSGTFFSLFFLHCCMWRKTSERRAHKQWSSTLASGPDGYCFALEGAPK